MTSDASKARFSQEELRDIFSYNEFTLCDTHELFGCECVDVTTKKTATKLSKGKLLHDEAQVAMWEHCLEPPTFLDPVLQQVGEQTDHITFFVPETNKGKRR